MAKFGKVLESADKKSRKKTTADRYRSYLERGTISFVSRLFIKIILSRRAFVYSAVQYIVIHHLKLSIQYAFFVYNLHSASPLSHPPSLRPGRLSKICTLQVFDFPLIRRAIPLAIFLLDFWNRERSGKKKLTQRIHLRRLSTVSM